MSMGPLKPVLVQVVHSASITLYIPWSRVTSGASFAYTCFLQCRQTTKGRAKSVPGAPGPRKANVNAFGDTFRYTAPKCPNGR